MSKPAGLVASVKGLAFAVALAAVLAGCASVSRLREAQDSFNRAATIENANQLAWMTADGEGAANAVASAGAASAGYASALSSLGRLDDEEREQLQRDGLWGTALTLRALCEWRLGKHDQALKTTNEARALAEQIYPRDAALLAALPGLIMTDQAYTKIVRALPRPRPREAGATAPATRPATMPSPRETYDEVKPLLIGPRGAIATIDEARRSADPDHPVQSYLLQAQLAAYRNYQVAQRDLNDGGDEEAANDARRAAQDRLNQLHRLLSRVPSQQRDAVIAHWQFVCGLQPPP
jgi:hypothetical protein